MKAGKMKEILNNQYNDDEEIAYAIWDKGDVKIQAYSMRVSLDEEELDEVVKVVHERQVVHHGINWEMIGDVIDDFVKIREKKRADERLRLREKIKEEVAFIIGAFKGDGSVEIEYNVKKAEDLAKWLWGKGYAVICPHTNSSRFYGLVDEEVFLSGYHKILTRVDVGFVLENWFSSQGSIDEIALCGRKGVRLVFVRKVDEGYEFINQKRRI